MAEQKAGRREWLIAAREKKELSINQAAFALKISPTLLTWLERGADTITHPGIADRIRKFYKLTVEQRNDIITKMAEAGIACNVHYKPLPMHTAYKALGFSISDYPNAYNHFANEISLPLHTCLTDADVASTLSFTVDAPGGTVTADTLVTVIKVQ